MHKCEQLRELLERAAAATQRGFVADTQLYVRLAASMVDECRCACDTCGVVWKGNETIASPLPGTVPAGNMQRPVPFQDVR